MSRTKRTLAVLAMLAIAATGCSSKKNETPQDLPAAATLLADSDKAMADVKTVHFTIDSSGKISGLSLHHAEGDLTKEGEAKGSANIEQFGMTIEAQFVIKGQTLYLKGPTGGYQQLPLSMAATVYDPSAILDTNRGVGKLLRTARNPKTEAKEQVDGKDAYKVSFEPDTISLGTIIPGAGSGSTALVWIAADTKRVIKGEFKLPASGSDPAGTVTVVFSNYDAPVSISAP